MIINNVAEMKNYLTSILSHGLKLQQIEMEDNLSIIFCVTDLKTGETLHTHLGFSENEAMAKQNVKRSMDQDTGGIILDQN